MTILKNIGTCNIHPNASAFLTVRILWPGAVIKRIFFTLIISFFLLPVLWAQSTIHITNGEWEPFLSEYSYQYGVNSHIIFEAFRLEGINVKWGFFPWVRAYWLAKHGEKWDASATWWSTRETEESFFVSEPVSHTSFVFFHLRSYKFDWESIDDLKGIEIGITLGYDYGKDFMTAIKGKRLLIQSVPTDEMNYRKLLKGRIHVFPNDPFVGYFQIRNSISPDKVKLFTHHPKKFEKSTLHLIISKKCANGMFFLRKFNSGLKRLKESGKYDQMFRDLNTGKYDKQKTIWKQPD